MTPDWNTVDRVCMDVVWPLPYVHRAWQMVNGKWWLSECMGLSPTTARHPTGAGARLSRRRTVWTRGWGWQHVHGWLGCAGKVLGRVLLDSGPWELAWWGHRREKGVPCPQWQQFVWRRRLAGTQWIGASGGCLFPERSLYLGHQLLFPFFLVHGDNVLTYMTDSLLRRGSSLERTISPVFFMLCLTQIYSFSTRSVCVTHVSVHVRGGETRCVSWEMKTLAFAQTCIPPKEVNVWYPTQNKHWGILESLAEPSTSRAFVLRKCWRIPRGHCSSRMTLLHHTSALCSHWVMNDLSGSVAKARGPVSPLVPAGVIPHAALSWSLPYRTPQGYTPA